MNNLEKAVELCTEIYKVSEPLGFFPALAGGTLYKEGERKDIDIVLCLMDHTFNLCTSCDMLTKDLHIPNLTMGSVYSGRVVKATYKGTDIDFIFPEAQVDNIYKRKGVQQ